MAQAYVQQDLDGSVAASSPSPSVLAPGKNKYPCISCQILRRKCDGKNGEPCSHCVKRRKECRYLTKREVGTCFISYNNEAPGAVAVGTSGATVNILQVPDPGSSEESSPALFAQGSGFDDTFSTGLAMPTDASLQVYQAQNHTHSLPFDGALYESSGSYYLHGASESEMYVTNVAGSYVNDPNPKEEDKMDAAIPDDPTDVAEVPGGATLEGEAFPSGSRPDVYTWKENTHVSNLSQYGLYSFAKMHESWSK
ncbi:hypothetical protein SCHPADRAFT_484313 [Schizopora paradoxa]|uniref:Zn(2)-C6 fungal-type domain-containing protein n=1 Tax=Schizopora paradoxa TaxID=27342 RepID=A0A0H2RNX0_9AGAM|nr:hypothetical protein SCHPADRAFT_484313 [Schizopora paradoxa]